MNDTKIEPIATDDVKCRKCGSDMKVYQFESTNVPMGDCPKCGVCNFAFFNTQTGKIETY